MARKTFIGNAFISITGDRKGLDAVLSQIRGSMQKLGKELQAWGYKLMGLGAAIQAPLTAAVYQFSKWGSEAVHAAERVGLLTSEFTELSYAAKLSGAGPEALEKALLAMERGLGGGKAKKALESIGLTLADLKGRPIAEQFGILADKIAGVEDPTKRAWLAMQLFGRGSAQLLPMLSLGRAGIEAYRAEAQRLGISIGPEMGGNAERLDKMLERLQESFRGLTLTVGNILAPAFTRVTTYLTNLVANVREYVQNNPQIITGLQQLAIALTAIGAALVGLGTASRVLSMLVSPGGVLLALGAVLVYISGALDPLIAKWGAAIMGFEVGGKTVRAWLDLIGETFGRLWETIKASLSTVAGVLQPVGWAVLAMVDSVWQQVKAGFMDFRLWLIDQIAGLVGVIQESMLELAENAKAPLLARQAAAGMSAVLSGVQGSLLKARTGWAGERVAQHGVAAGAKQNAASEFGSALSALGQAGGAIGGQWKSLFGGLGGKWGGALAPLLETIFGEKGAAGGVKGFLDIFQGLGRPFKDMEPAMALATGPSLLSAGKAIGTFSGRGAAAMGSGPMMQIQREQLDVLEDIRDKISVGGVGGEDF